MDTGIITPADPCTKASALGISHMTTPPLVIRGARVPGKHHAANSGSAPAVQFAESPE